MASGIQQLPGSHAQTRHSQGFFTGTLPAIVPAICPEPAFGDGVGSTCENKSVGAECWAYCLKELGMGGST